MTFFCNLIGRQEVKSHLWLDNVETLNRLPDNFEIFWNFWNSIWNFGNILKYWKILKFWNLIGRLEMKSRLWLDNFETLNRPPEAHTRWTHSELTKKVLFRPISEKQNSLSFNNAIFRTFQLMLQQNYIHALSVWTNKIFLSSLS